MDKRQRLQSTAQIPVSIYLLSDFKASSLCLWVAKNLAVVRANDREKNNVNICLVSSTGRGEP